MKRFGGHWQATTIASRLMSRVFAGLAISVSIASAPALADPVITLTPSPAPAHIESAPCIVSGILCQQSANPATDLNVVATPAEATKSGQRNTQDLANWPAAAGDAQIVAALDLGSVNLDTGLPETDHAYVGTDSFDVIAVPEPSTWGMLLSGLALFGWMARRRVLT